MRRLVAPYREFFRQPGVIPLVGVALFARLPFGMVGLSMLMLLREALGSYALAGSVSGVYFVAMAVGAPVQGRLIDRYGPRLTLLATGIVHPVSLAAILAGALAGTGYTAIAVAAALAGLFAPPTNVLARTLWRHRFEGEEDRRRAFSIDAVLIELNLTLGPAIVAAVLAVANATAAFALAIAVSVAALATFAASPALAYLRPAAAAPRALLGPLAEPRLLAVFAATFGLATSIGFLEVGYPGYATRLGSPALAGVFLSASSLGSAVGGAVFGALTLRTPVERQFAAAAGLMCLPLLLHYPVDGAPAFMLAAFLAGALIAPAIACQSVLVSRLAPAHQATEAFTWSATFIVCGLGTGIAVGGWLLETAGAKIPFVAGSALMAVVALGALATPARPRA